MHARIIRNIWGIWKINIGNIYIYIYSVLLSNLCFLDPKLVPRRHRLEPFYTYCALLKILLMIDSWHGFNSRLYSSHVWHQVFLWLNFLTSRNIVVYQYTINTIPLVNNVRRYVILCAYICVLQTWYARYRPTAIIDEA